MSSLLITENKLDYIPSKTHSLATDSRFYTVRAPSKTLSDNDVAEVVLSLSSNDFIDPSESYIAFDFEGKSAAHASFPLSEDTDPRSYYGSIVKVFKSIQLIAKDGSEIDNHDNVYQYATTKMVYATDTSVLEPLAYGMLYKKLDVDKNTIYKIHIPLNLLVNLFTYDNLLPPTLMDGMRMRFKLNDVFNLVVGSTQTDFSYTVENFRATFKTYRMDNLAIKQLNAEPKKSISYTTYFHRAQRFLPAANSTVLISMPVNFECKKATRAFGMAIDIPADDAAKFFNELTYEATFDTKDNVRWRIGQTYTDALHERTDQMAQTRYAFRVKTAAAAYGSFSEIGVQAIDLTRSPVGIGGTPVDNHNGVVLEMRKLTNVAQMAHIFLEYERTINF